MSTGGSGDLGSLGTASVEVKADMSGVDAAFASLPSKIANKLGDAEQKIRAQMARIKLDMKTAMSVGDDRLAARFASDLEDQAKKLAATRASIARAEAATRQQAENRRAAQQAKADARSEANARKAAERQAAADAKAEAAALAKQERIAAAQEKADARSAASAEKRATREKAATEKAAAKDAAIKEKADAKSAKEFAVTAEIARADHYSRIAAESSSTVDASASSYRYAADLAGKGKSGSKATADVTRLNREMATASPEDMGAIQAKLDAANARARGANSFSPADVAAGKYARSLGQVDAGQKRVQGSSRNLGMSVLYVSQAIDDAQYGFAGVVNNIPGIVAMMGGGAGLAGVAQLAAVGVNYLVNHWSKLKSSLGEDSPITQAMNALQGLAESLGLATSESQKLKEAEEKRKKAAAEHADAKVKGIKATGTAERGNAIEAAIASVGGGEAAVAMIAKATAPTGDPKLAAARKAREDEDARMAGFGSPDAIARDKQNKAQRETEQKNEDERVARIRLMVSGATEGNVDDVKRLRAMAPASLRAAIEENSPEHKAEVERFAKEKADAEAASQEVNTKAEAEAKKAQDAADHAAKQRASNIIEATGPQMRLDLLGARTEGDREIVRSKLSGRIQAGGEKLDTAAKVSEKAVADLSAKLEEEIEAQITSKQAKNRGEATENLRASARVEAGKAEDGKAAKVRAELGQDFNPRIYSGVSEYLAKLQTSPEGDKAVKEAIEINKKLDESNKNLKLIAEKVGGPARWGRRGGPK